MKERAAALGVLLLKIKPGIDRVFARALLLAVTLAAAAMGTVLAQPSSAQTATQECRGVKSGNTSFVEQCGDRLNAWSLILPEFKREIGGDLHGRFYFNCSIELMCEGEPLIVGSFVNRAEWQGSARGERAIYELANAALSVPSGPLPPMPPLACPVFDISIAGTAGRAVCFEESGEKAAWSLLLLLTIASHFC